MESLYSVPSASPAVRPRTSSASVSRPVGLFAFPRLASIASLLLAFSTFGFVLPVLADPTDWAPSLKSQLQTENGCQFQYMLNVKEYRFLNRDVIEARVYCEDGRMFDVTRRSPDRRFEIKECSLNTC
jgi:hypothetical protein